MRIAKNKKLIFTVILYSILISFFYGFFSYKRFDAFSAKFNNVKAELKFVLPQKDAYILNIWNPLLPRQIYFNGRQVSPAYVTKKHGLENAYVILPADYAVKGDNLLNISGDGKYSLKIRNFFGAAKSKNIYILLNSSKLAQERRLGLQKFILTVCIVSLLLFIILLPLIRLEIEIFPIYLISYAPYFLCFSLFLLVSLFSPLRIIMSNAAFIVLSLLLVGIIKVPMVTYALFKKYKSKAVSSQDDAGARIVSLAISGKGNLGEGLVFLFMWFILFAVASFIWGLDILGEFIINIAYVVLVVALGIKIFRRIKG